jgi:hypothetical protein
MHIRTGSVAHLAASALLAIAVSSLAQTSPSGSPSPLPFAESFKRADSDGNGELSKGEAVKGGFFARESFDNADRDGSGGVTLLEVGKAAGEGVKGWMDRHQKADTSQDGRVSKQEASGSTWSDVFQPADKNQDGELSREEVMAHVTHGYYSETATQPLVPNLFDEKF